MGPRQHGPLATLLLLLPLGLLVLSGGARWGFLSAAPSAAAAQRPVVKLGALRALTSQSNAVPAALRRVPRPPVTEFAVPRTGAGSGAPPFGAVGAFAAGLFSVAALALRGRRQGRPPWLAMAAASSELSGSEQQWADSLQHSPSDPRRAGSDWSRPGGWVRPRRPGEGAGAAPRRPGESADDAERPRRMSADANTYAYRQNPVRRFVSMRPATGAAPESPEPEPEPLVDERGVRLRWTKQVVTDFTPDLGLINMMKGLKKGEEWKVIVDIRDARMPRTSDHPVLRSIRRKAVGHIIVFTHCDLLEDLEVSRLFVWAQRTYGLAVIFCMDLSSAEFVREKHHEATGLSLFKEAVSEACTVAADRKAFCCGLPNIGKSSIILPMVRDIHKRRRKKGEFHNPKVENVIGKTKGIKGHLFIELENPTMPAHWGYHPVTMGHFLMDTPGLPLPPEVYHSEPEVYFKTVLLNISPPATAHDVVDMADFILWKCNRRQKYKYMELLGLKEPTDDIIELLSFIDSNSRTSAFARRKAAEAFVKATRDTGFIKFVLDDLDLTEKEEQMAKELHLAYDSEAVVLATNYAPGWFSRPVVRHNDGTLRRATLLEVQRKRPEVGMWARQG
eukprot:EG_transcript_5907